MLDANSSLPHDGPTVIVELMGATHDVDRVFNHASNPHYGITQASEKPEQPPTIPIPYTTERFPKLTPSYATLFGNLNEATTKQVRSHPGCYIALIPFGAGQRLTQDNPELAKDLETFLKSLGFPGSNHLQVARPTPSVVPPNRARFAKPFPYLLLNAPEPLCRLLLWQQTFAFQINSKHLAFNAVSPDVQVESWVILNLSGSFVTPEQLHMINALRTIATTLMTDRAFLSMTNTQLAKRGIGKTATERAMISISTFRLTFIPRTLEDGIEQPIWQLQGMPISRDLKTHLVWLRIIRRTHFMVNNILSLEPDKSPFGCVWCKAETHSSENCPLPNTNDWKGPTPAHEYLTPDPPVRASDSKKHWPK